MKRTIKLGRHVYEGHKNCPVEIEVEVHPREEGGHRLSIVGLIWKANRSDIYSGGQNLEEIAELVPTAKVKRIVEVWREYHLNDMQAACEHQRARDETWWTHPSAVCPDCDYRLGSAWLYKEIPADILAEIGTW